MAGRTRRRRAPAGARRITVLAVGVWLLTALGAGVGHLLPALGPGTHLHPTLHGTLGELLSLLANNLRVLGAPFLLAAFHWPRGRLTRRLGDLLIAGLITWNTLSVGLALGRYGAALLPYVPQLPLEWGALAVSGAAWLCARDGEGLRVLALYALAMLALTAGAGTVEVLLTPHAHDQTSRQRADAVCGPSRLVGNGYRLPTSSFAPGGLASRSLRSLPLAALGSALRLTGASRTSSTTRSPQGGTT